VSELFTGRLAEEPAVPFDTILEYVNQLLAPQHTFGPNEARVALEGMAEANDIMLSENVVYQL